MAKARQIRRAERERKQLQALELQAKRMRRKQFWRKVTLYERRRRSRGKLFARRSRGQRAFITVMAVAGLLVIWTTIGSLGLRVLLTALLVLAMPVLVIVTFDRRNS